MHYYIQISLWLVLKLGLHVTPMDTIYNYTDGSTVQVIPINYADSMGLHNWVDSSRTYYIQNDTDSKRANIVQLTTNDFK